MTMRTLCSATSVLVIIDFQSRLMPAIEDGKVAVANAERLVRAAEMFAVPVLFTEQNPKGLGTTLPGLACHTETSALHKMTFDACKAPAFFGALGNRRDVVVAGCEAHVCVLQTVLGLLDADRRVYVVRDAVGSRLTESKETAIERMQCHGAEAVTTEMVIFEWLGTAAHPYFRDAVALIK